MGEAALEEVYGAEAVREVEEGRLGSELFVGLSSLS